MRANRRIHAGKCIRLVTYLRCDLPVTREAAALSPCGAGPTGAIPYWPYGAGATTVPAVRRRGYHRPDRAAPGLPPSPPYGAGATTVPTVRRRGAYGVLPQGPQHQNGSPPGYTFSPAQVSSGPAASRTGGFAHRRLCAPAALRTGGFAHRRLCGILRRGFVTSWLPFALSANWQGSRAARQAAAARTAQFSKIVDRCAHYRAHTYPLSSSEGTARRHARNVPGRRQECRRPPPHGPPVTLNTPLCLTPAPPAQAQRK
jgi:hypothetical protein